MTEICIYYDSRVTIYDRRAFKRMATVEKIAWKLAFTKWSQSATKHSRALRWKKNWKLFSTQPFIAGRSKFEASLH